MAVGTTNFLVFDENRSNMVGDSTYKASEYRVNGCRTGIAPSNIHNKAFFQATTMVSALAQSLANKGFDVLDNDYETLVSILGNLGAGGGEGKTGKIVYTVNGTYTATKDEIIKITAVAGGGGGSSCMGCGGGSGQSASNKVVSLKKGDTIVMTIGSGGAGNTNYRNDVTTPSDGSIFAGADARNTIIKINGVVAETVTLTGGKGATCPNPASVQYKPGTGENNGGVMNWNMYDSGAQSTYWNGGDGAPSIFGAGGKGGTITYQDFYKADGGDALSYGAGGGGGGFRLKSNYSWTSGGDGMQGVVVLEVQ